MFLGKVVEQRRTDLVQTSLNLRFIEGRPLLPEFRSVLTIPCKKNNRVLFRALRFLSS